MKLKLTMALLALAGVAAALAVATPTRADDGPTTTGATTTAGAPTDAGDRRAGKGGGQNGHGKSQGGNAMCRPVELRGSAGSGTVTLTVGRSSHAGASLAGKQVTLTIPPGTLLDVEACVDASGAVVMRGLHVGRLHGPGPVPPTATGAGSNMTGAGVKP
jgi:hypothetical protein